MKSHELKNRNKTREGKEGISKGGKKPNKKREKAIKR
jgi:hypothetical protein